MEVMHSYLRERNVSCVYLSTSDKLNFYTHLGYEKCSPVTPLSSASQLVDTGGLNALKAAFGGKPLSSFGRCIWLKRNLE
jgi:hypothetical protein